MSRLLFSRNRGQVDVTLHRWQRFNLASCPASLPLPQTARRANAEPAVATGFSNDPFVVIDVGHASHRHHAGLKYLREWVNMAAIVKTRENGGGGGWFDDKSQCGRPYLHLPLWRKLNDSCSVYFTQQNTTCTWKKQASEDTLKLQASNKEATQFTWDWKFHSIDPPLL